MRVLRGLRREIPVGPHRFHSIILCDTLEHLTTNGLKDDQSDAFTDGEIKVHFSEYDQSHCLCKFKPANEEGVLAEYLKTEGALTAEDILREVRGSKVDGG